MFEHRNNIVKELKTYGLDVDIFGNCGKSDPCKKKRYSSCVKSLFRKYKFYIAFENSQCSEYITEKTWKSLSYGAVPIVSGASMENYN